MVTREDMVEQSVSDFAREKLTLLEYIPNVCDLREAFPTPDERASEMEKTQVAVGFNFDDGGRQAEMGSNLIRRVYTMEFWTFGLTSNEGRNVANVIKAIFESNPHIPLKDVGVAGQPVIDQLELLDEKPIGVTRQISRDPRPWDQWVFSTTMRVEDYYVPPVI